MTQALKCLLVKPTALKWIASLIALPGKLVLAVHAKTTTRFAAEAGARVRAKITDYLSLSLSLEYLYADLGSATAPTFTLYNQNVLLGLSWA